MAHCSPLRIQELQEHFPEKDGIFDVFFSVMNATQFIQTQTRRSGLKLLNLRSYSIYLPVSLHLNCVHLYKWHTLGRFLTSERETRKAGPTFEYLKSQSLNSSHKPSPIRISSQNLRMSSINPSTNYAKDSNLHRLAQPTHPDTLPFLILGSLFQTSGPPDQTLYKEWMD